MYVKICENRKFYATFVSICSQIGQFAHFRMPFIHSSTYLAGSGASNRPASAVAER
jgi:hypothetical protein